MHSVVESGASKSVSGHLHTHDGGLRLPSVVPQYSLRGL